MRRQILLAAALLLTPTFAVAQQTPLPKDEPARVENPQVPPTALASAVDVRIPKAEPKSAEAPAKKRIARVTTCRCGDVPPPQH